MNHRIAPAWLYKAWTWVVLLIGIGYAVIGVWGVAAGLWAFGLGIMAMRRKYHDPHTHH